MRWAWLWLCPLALGGFVFLQLTCFKAHPQVQDGAELVCKNSTADSDAPRIAYCISGTGRTLGRRFVHGTIRDLAIGSIGPGDVFLFVNTLDADPNGVKPAPPLTPQDEVAISAYLQPLLVRFVPGTLVRAECGVPSAKQLRTIGQQRGQLDCYDAMLAVEAGRGQQYDFFVRLRTDVAYLGRLPSIDEFPRDRVTGIWNHHAQQSPQFAVIPRHLVQSYTNGLHRDPCAETHYNPESYIRDFNSQAPRTEMWIIPWVTVRAAEGANCGHFGPDDARNPDRYLRQHCDSLFPTGATQIIEWQENWDSFAKMRINSPGDKMRGNIGTSVFANQAAYHANHERLLPADFSQYPYWWDAVAKKLRT